MDEREGKKYMWWITRGQEENGEWNRTEAKIQKG